MNSAGQSTPVRVAIHGAAGRMGRRLVALGNEDPAIEVVAAVERPGLADLGRDAGELAGVGAIGVPLTDDLPVAVDALIDFSTADAVERVLDLCQQKSVPLVLATTGFPAETMARVRELSSGLPVVWSPNMSLAVNLTMKLAQVAAECLAGYGPGVDVEIIERHHRFKEDAPSGTALHFGSIISDVLGSMRAVHGREGRTGKRGRDEIGYHAVRTGDNPGEHTIVFGMLGETVELGVKATNRDAYAIGALAAAKWVSGKGPGLYDMNDVFGL